ncbi:hypothetical protein ATI61_118133 [Archangium gephyra]|uniref:Lipoprotein n=1 Tax=Archangium gephyra TaxID=48 RepID=A0ABX9JNB4_9BACT|nr:hypothetical protein [Archangium gephyra]REG22928.1 hypothetical protein ATI61_118133 [Archangium gephyra]
MTVLAGCEEPRGTGKDGELYVLSSGEVASGLYTTVRINDWRTWPEHSDPVDSDRLERWDFKGTTLEVQAPPGFDFEITLHQAPANYLQGGYRLRTRCDAEPGRAHEVRVRVMAGSEVRYEDAFELTCLEPTRLELVELVHPYAAPGRPGEGRYFVGGAIEAGIALFADTPRGEVWVGGEGLVLTDSRGILRMGEPEHHVRRNSGQILEVAAPGTEPELSFRGASLRLPMEAVLDEGWSLELGTWQGPPGLDYAERTLDAWARGSDGSELRGLQRCAWTTEVPGTEMQDEGCRLHLWGPPAVSGVCVTAYGRTTCGP